jgi:LemA protein
VVKILVLALVAIIATWMWITYNKLVLLRNEAKTSWNQVEAELQQRLDLIPNLVGTVKGYAKHERETLENVTLARSRAISASTPDEILATNNILSQTLSRLLMLNEEYPQLRADSSFLKLQSELSDLERRINLSRRYFNESARVYNTAQQEFPTILVAGWFGHSNIIQYVADPQAHIPPTIDFQALDRSQK